MTYNSFRAYRINLEDRLIKRKTLSVALKYSGIRGGIAHLVARVFGDPRFLRPASSIDFRHFGLHPSVTLNELIHSLAPQFTEPEIQSALDKAVIGVDELMDTASGKLSFPERWNSGRNLQYLLSALIILLKPNVVVETGSANGASALAICFGLDHNKVGHLWSFDIEQETGQLVPDFLRSRVSFIQVNGDEEDFRKNLLALDLDSGCSIFLHDADHSYLGQESDYRLAKETGFKYILSDDVDTSLAFCDFAGSNGQIFYDAPKFIGAVKMVSE